MGLRRKRSIGQAQISWSLSDCREPIFLIQRGDCGDAFALPVAGEVSDFPRSIGGINEDFMVANQWLLGEGLSIRHRVPPCQCSVN